MSDNAPMLEPAIGTTMAGTLTAPSSTLLRRDVGLWAVFITLDACTQMAFKAGGNALTGVEFGAAWFDRFAATPAIWLGIAGYIIAFVLWIAILQGSELTRAFTLTGVSFATVPLGGWLLFGEQISAARLVGIALIVAGVTMISRRSPSSG